MDFDVPVRRKKAAAEQASADRRRRERGHAEAQIKAATRIQCFVRQRRERPRTTLRKGTARIRRWWRGHHARATLRKTLQTRLDKKISDCEKVDAKLPPPGLMLPPAVAQSIRSQVLMCLRLGGAVPLDRLAPFFHRVGAIDARLAQMGFAHKQWMLVRLGLDVWVPPMNAWKKFAVANKEAAELAVSVLADDKECKYSVAWCRTFLSIPGICDMLLQVENTVLWDRVLKCFYYLGLQQEASAGREAEYIYICSNLMGLAPLFLRDRVMVAVGWSLCVGYLLSFVPSSMFANHPSASVDEARYIQLCRMHFRFDPHFLGQLVEKTFGLHRYGFLNFENFMLAVVDEELNIPHVEAVFRILSNLLSHDDFLNPFFSQQVKSAWISVTFSFDLALVLWYYLQGFVTHWEDPEGLPAAHVFWVTLDALLQVLNDNEVSALRINLPQVVQLLSETMSTLLCRGNPPSGQILASGAVLLRTLQNLNSRGAFAVAETSWCDGGIAHQWRSGGDISKAMKWAPSLLPFVDRVEIFRNACKHSEGHPFRFVVRRNFLFEDGYAALCRQGVDWRQKFEISFVNAQGLPEAGQDMGGLFKEFWEELAVIAFSQNYGLFDCTKSKRLYPNPSAEVYHPTNAFSLFRFLGSVFGKALLEGILIAPQFAPFFLKKIQGRDVDVAYYDLQSRDRELFDSLEQLKTYQGDIENDLCLSFTTPKHATGEDVELIPNGKEIPVTQTNRFKYLYLVGHYKLHTEIAAASKHFVEGIGMAIDPKLLNMFSIKELQKVLSGDDAPLDIDDWKRHTIKDGFSYRDKVEKYFWQAIKELPDDKRRQILRFVTSSPRAPLGGFSYLFPPFRLTKIESSGDDRLPSASTCFNILKLPSYSSVKVMKQKLEYIANSDIGFELA